MGSGPPRRMRCAAGLLCLAAWLCAGGARSCPAQIPSCKCVGERPKGPGLPGAARRKVICSDQELPEPPDPRLLPNTTVTLLLSNNKITVLKNGSFFGLRALEKLDLKNNLISTIQPGAFLGLLELKRLDISNNRIGCLSASVFQGLANLLRLNVSGNIFSSLQPGVFDELPSLKVVDFATEYLTCDCNLRWMLPWSRNRSAQISDKTLCIYPSPLHAKPLRSVRESQLQCVGAPELHTHHLIPSLRQVVFQGDRLPFQCTATYLDSSTRILWYHNRVLVEGDEQTGIILEESLIHDCTFITSELILSNIHVSANGEWECAVSTSQGNVSKKVEIVVLETSASYCPAERVTNNRGDFRWPRTLAGITAYQSCLQYPFTSLAANGSPVAEKQASRRCDRMGRWEEGDYSHCLYTNDITRVLYTFVLMPINASNALTLAHQLRVYTAEAANFSDMMDVIYVAQMIEKFIGYVDQIKQLPDVMVEMASNMMLVDDHILWMAQIEDKACTSIVRSLEKIAGYVLSSNSQHVAVNSRNIAFEAYLIKPESYTGLSCTAFQKRDSGHPSLQEQEAEPLADQQLKFRCTTGRPNISLANFHIKELSNFPSEAPGPAEVLHPVLYTCTALLLLCLFTTIITYIINHSTIQISRKCWHMLLNLCFYIAMTSAVFAGGITLTNYMIVCQAVGIILHYSSLSTLLWMAVKARVIYKEVTWKAPQQQEGDVPQPAPRPMLRFYLIAGGIPLIICGITAAVNIHNYQDNNPYCWLVWRPSLGAFYVPVAFILLITWIYFLCTGVNLWCQSKNQKDPPVPLETPPRLGGSSNLLTDSGSISVTLNSGTPSADVDGVYSLKMQFWALLITHFLYIALWTFGAVAVSQRWYLNVIFSCLYGVTAVALGLFIFIHHCARRRDVQNSWFACCPSYRNALPMQAYVHPGLAAEEGSQIFIGCNPEVAHSIKSSSSPSSTNSTVGHCKLTNLQVAQNQAESCPLPRPACYEETELANNKNAGAARYANNIHGRRNHKSRTKQYREGKHHRLKVLRGPSSDHPSSESGSLHNSHSESYHSSRNSPLNNSRLGPRVAAVQEGDAALTQSEGSDGGSSGHRVPDFSRAQRRSASRDNLKQAHTIEKETKRRSYPLNVANQNGGLKGSKYDINLTGAESMAGMKTGLWKSETTV
ncbi:adhesion G protein-coupled receptor A2 isoform X2 [Chrysemys picta bellii]|uniref:adhesion G protein-coupled receptor A2 isoform X2 n=1 Tax=Chrysemys picta bellii TaxID=8478 RepID=UPI0032B116D4